MGVIYKLNCSVYHEVLKCETLEGKRENEVNIIFYNDKIEVRELDIKFELDRRDIRSIKNNGHTIIETIFGYNIIILEGVVQNKKSMMQYLNLYINDVKSLDESSIRIDTINQISTIKMNNSAIEFDLRKVDDIVEDNENIYFLNQTILFKKIKLPKFIFANKNDKENFLESLKFNNIKLKRLLKKIFLK